MKKLSFILAMAFAAGTAMAQVSTVNQTATGSYGNSATVTQTQANFSNIDQTTWGEGHIAIVKQINDEPTVLESANKSVIVQEQRGADVNVFQDGMKNVSGLVQAGPNSANIMQDGDANILGGLNFLGNAYQKNGTSFSDDNNVLTLTQAGDRNKAGVSQQHHGTADIDQIGDDNRVTVDQSGAAGLQLQTAEVEQKGDFNFAALAQYGEGNRAEIEVDGNLNTTNATQNGFDNRAKVELIEESNSNSVIINQTNNSAGLGNRVYLKMKGSENKVNFSQTGSWNQIGGKDMFPDLAFEGVTDADMLKYNGNNATIDVAQTGNQNVVKSDMNNSYGDIDILQNGNLNITNLFINDGLIPFGSHNDANISQTGTGNLSTNNVVGSYNEIKVTQAN